jgi:DNA-binding XRE family transcriptional regulator
MPETPPVQADLFQRGSPPRAEDPVASGASAVVAPATAHGQPAPSGPEAAPAGDLTLFQPWLHAIRQERRIAQALAPALTPMLLAAYIERYLTTDEAPSREALASALAAQRPDLVRHLSAWMRRRPIPARQEALWQGLYHWLLPRLQAWVCQALAARLGQAQLDALTPEAWRTTVQDDVGTTPCPLEQVAVVLGQESAELLQALSQALDLPQCTHEELQKLLRLRPIRRGPDRPHPESPLFLTRPIAPVATGSPMLSSAQALLRQDLWQPEGENVPTYRRLFSHGHSIEHYITTSDPHSRTVEALAGDAAWQIVQQFGLPTAFFHLVFAAYATAQPEPWRGLFELRGSDLLRTVGLATRTDVPRADKLREVVRQARLLDSLGVWVVWHEPNRDLSVQMSRMWDVALQITGPKEPDGSITPTEVLLTVRPGLWTQKFLNAAGARAGTALRQFGYLAQNTLRIDPYHQELAAKLAVYLTLMSRLRRVYQVQHLLEAIETAAVLRAAAADFRRRYKYKQRWDEALLTLHEQGWQLTFDDATYPLALRPDWALPADTPAHLRRLPTDYWRRLLAATLTLTPPEPIPALLAAVVEEERPAARTSTRPPPPWLAPTPPPPPLTGTQVRQARQAKSWSQQELARRVGKSQQWVALIEQDKRTMQLQDQVTLRTLLDLTPKSPEP